VCCTTPYEPVEGLLARLEVGNAAVGEPVVGVPDERAAVLETVVRKEVVVVQSSVRVPSVPSGVLTRERSVGYY
jgi:hypothetical protein